MSAPKKVASGTFRVHREAMLAKLAAFSLQNPAEALLCWLRAAAHSGARQVRVRNRPGGLELRFGGRTFSREDLAEPYACLYDEAAPRSRRHRELAIGMLTLLAREGGRAGVSIESGERGRRVRLEARSHAAEALVPAREIDTDETVIAMSLPKALIGPSLDQVRLQRGLPTFDPVTVSIDGALLPLHRPHQSGLTEVAEEGVRGRLRLDPAAARSRLALYAGGWRAGDVEVTLEEFQARGEVDSDRFDLDLSGTAVARNETFESVMRRVALLALRVGWRELAEIRSRFDKTAPPWGPTLRLRSCWRVAADPDAPELQALRDAIFFLDGYGHPIGLRAIQALLGDGRVPLQFESPTDRKALLLVFPKGKFLSVPAHPKA